ncbi:MAG: hypothetical protein COU35_05025, partial [Candidatus Magasanikbacteria bacterium CG10_big_fil_rev_8_21_14_0_10_47_10]
MPCTLYVTGILSIVYHLNYHLFRMSEISKSIQIICDEKGLEYETVMAAIESALGAAYRKDFGNRQ